MVDWLELSHFNLIASRPSLHVASPSSFTVRLPYMMAQGPKGGNSASDEGVLSFEPEVAQYRFCLNLSKQIPDLRGEKETWTPTFVGRSGKGLSVVGRYQNCVSPFAYLWALSSSLGFVVTESIIMSILMCVFWSMSVKLFHACNTRVESLGH